MHRQQGIADAVSCCGPMFLAVKQQRQDQSMRHDYSAGYSSSAAVHFHKCVKASSVQK